MNMYWVYDLPNWLFGTLTVAVFVMIGLAGLYLTHAWARRLHIVDHSHNDIVGFYLAAVTVFMGSHWRCCQLEPGPPFPRSRARSTVRQLPSAASTAISAHIRSPCAASCGTICAGTRAKRSTTKKTARGGVCGIQRTDTRAASPSEQRNQRDEFRELTPAPGRFLSVGPVSDSGPPDL